MSIWHPQGLLNLAQRPTDPAVFASQEKLRTDLDHLGLGTAWCAMTTRGYQLNGRAAEITFIRRPGESYEHIREFQDMMATTAGTPPDQPGLDYSCVKIIVFSDSLLKGDPREIVTELTTQSGRSRGSQTGFVPATCRIRREMRRPSGQRSGDGLYIDTGAGVTLTKSSKVHFNSASTGDDHIFGVYATSSCGRSRLPTLELDCSPAPIVHSLR